MWTFRVLMLTVILIAVGPINGKLIELILASEPSNPIRRYPLAKWGGGGLYCTVCLRNSDPILFSKLL